MELSSYAKGSDFEDRVSRLLRSVGYEVEANRRVAGSQVDLLVAIPGELSFPGRLTYLVECKDEKYPLGVQVVRDTSFRVKTARETGEVGRHVLGWIISNSDLTQDAKPAADRDGIFFTRYDDLLRRVIDLEAYHSRLVDAFQQEKEKGGYIDPIGRIKKESATGDGTGDSEDNGTGNEDSRAGSPFLLNELVSRHLLTSSKPILLLGGPGMGKTLYAKWLARDLVEQRRAGDWRVVPVLVPLKEIEAFSDEFVFEYLRRQGVSPGVSIERFMRDIGLTLILDGLDYLLDPQQSPEIQKLEIRRWLRKFADLQRAGNRLVITCRTDFYEHYVRPYLPAVESGADPGFEIIIIEPFDDGMVQRYLQGYAEAEKAQEAKEEAAQQWQMLVDCHLDDMARVPVLLQLIARHIKDLPNLVKYDEPEAKAILAIIKYDIERTALLGQEDKSAYIQLQRAAWQLWRDKSLLLDEDTPQDVCPVLSDSTVRGVCRDILKALACHMWQESSLEMQLDDLLDLLEVAYQSEELSLSISTIRGLFKDILSTGVYRNRSALSRDELERMLAHNGSATLPISIMKATLAYIEDSTTILKRRKKRIAFAHSIFRDILVAESLAERLRAGSADDVTIGAELGRFIIELLEKEPYCYDLPDTVPPGMTFVPAGPAIIAEGHATQIRCLQDDFFIGRHHVTKAEFTEFVLDDRYSNNQWWSDTGINVRDESQWKGPQSFAMEGFDDPQQPIVGVSFYEAEAYCKWLSHQRGCVVRLPTSLEWEKAARGIDGRRFPWGNQEGFSLCATAERGFEHPQPVGRFSPDGDSPYGVADMAGNVWEWVANPDGTSAVRGGSFKTPLNEARCALTKQMEPQDRSNDIGFRIVQEIST